MRLTGDREREVWNAALRAAMRACTRVDRASQGQGHRVGRPKRVNPPGRNPNAHRLAEISLGALRAKDEIAGLLK